MSLTTLLLPLIQTGIQGFLQYKMAADGRNIAIKTARAYVQGVRAARLVALLLLGITVLAITNVIAGLLVTHAGYLIYIGEAGAPWSSWVWGEIIAGAAVVLIDIVVLIAVSNERLWMNAFKVPALLDNILNVEPTKVRFS